MHVSGSLLTAINNFPFIKRNAATACCASSPSRYSRRSAWHHGLNKLTLMGRCNDNNHRICARFMPLYGNKKKGRASIGPTKPICQRGEGCVRASLCVGDGASQCSRAPKRQCMTIQRKRCTPGGVYPHWWHTNHKAPDTQINKHKNGCWSQPQNTIKTQHTNNLFVYTLRRVTRNVRIRSNSSSSACMRIRVNSRFFFGCTPLVSTAAGLQKICPNSHCSLAIQMPMHLNFRIAQQKQRTVSGFCQYWLQTAGAMHSFTLPKKNKKIAS